MKRCARISTNSGASSITSSRPSNKDIIPSTRKSLRVPDEPGTAASRIPHPASRIPHPASRPASRIPHLASRIPSRIPHPASRIPHLMLLSPTIAFAHTRGGEATGFLSGLSHPVSGLDHILAMIAVGLWGAQLGPPAIWLLPVTFPMVMAFGGTLGLLGVKLPGVESRHRPVGHRPRRRRPLRGAARGSATRRSSSESSPSSTATPTAPSCRPAPTACSTASASSSRRDCSTSPASESGSCTAGRPDASDCAWPARSSRSRVSDSCGGPSRVEDRDRAPAGPGSIRRRGHLRRWRLRGVGAHDDDGPRPFLRWPRASLRDARGPVPGSWSLTPVSGDRATAGPCCSFYRRPGSGRRGRDCGRTEASVGTGSRRPDRRARRARRGRPAAVAFVGRRSGNPAWPAARQPWGNGDGDGPGGRVRHLARRRRGRLRGGGDPGGAGLFRARSLGANRRPRGRAGSPPPASSCWAGRFGELETRFRPSGYGVVT